MEGGSPMSRKDKATVAYVGPFLLLLMLGMSLGMSLGLLQKWHEEERARLQVEEEVREARQQAAEIEEKYGRLRQWMEDLGLPIEVEAEDVEEEEIPAVEDERVPLAPEEVSPASDFSTAGLIYPSGYGPETRDRWFPQGIQPVMEIYLGWRERYPEGYARLVAWGRGEVPPRQLDPAMIEASRIAAAGQNIDDYMAHWPHSPLGGYGQDFAYAGWKYGVNPYLLIALTAAESTFATDGSLCRTHHNAWGMKGPNKTGLYAENGWMWWPDWPSAIDGAAYFVSVYWPGAQTAYQLRGYCEGNPPDWFRTVETVRNGMGGAMP